MFFDSFWKSTHVDDARGSLRRQPVRRRFPSEDEISSLPLLALFAYVCWRLAVPLSIGCVGLLGLGLYRLD